ncbi:MAG: protoheme IX farnesyltransferase [Chloroflexota bacterium]|nr:MAG: protoheme IX farnesyltransferase [Chloroflexota bacterium]
MEPEPRSVTVLRPRVAVAGMRTYLGLLKARIVVPMVAVALVTAFVAGNGQVPLGIIVALALAGGLASAGAACLNHYLDRDVDAIMPRTRQRPIPSGEVHNPATALLLGLALIGLGLAFASRLSHASLVFIALGAFFYVVVYTGWLKRSSPLNVVIGGFAGSCAALAGWLAVSPQLSLTPVLVGTMIFLWTPSHFWSLAIALQQEYRQAGIPMLPVLLGRQRTACAIFAHTALTFLTSLLPYHAGLLGLPYLTIALAAGFVALLSALRLLAQPSAAVAWQNYKLSGIYLAALFVGMLVNMVA